MADFSISLESFDSIARELSAAADNLSQDLAHACEAAADEAVRAMQARHPYTDRTYRLSGGMSVRLSRQTRYTAEAVVEFDADYACYVDAKEQYAFTPTGEAAAQPVLDRCAEDAVGKFCSALGG